MQTPAPPPPDGAPTPAARRAAARYALHLLYREAAGSGGAAAEVVALARAVHRADPDDAENAGLLALLLLREAARGTGPDLARTERLVAEATAVLDAVRPGPAGPYLLCARIAAVRRRGPLGPADRATLDDLYARLRGCGIRAP